MNPRLRKNLIPIIAVLFGLGFGAIVMLLSGYNPLVGYTELFFQAFGSSRSIGETISTMAPLILTALSFAVSMRVGLFNIGMSGQAMAGWVMSVWFVLNFPGMPKALLILLAVIVGMFSGLVMGVIPGFLKAKLGTSEVIVTIMMNYIIMYGANFIQRVVMSRGIIDSAASTQTKQVGANASLQLSWLKQMTDGSSLNMGIVFALIALVIIAILFAKTTLGYEIKAVGLNPAASEYAGMSATKTIILSMMIAGALSGLAGTVYGLGNLQYFAQRHTSMSIGFDGMAVALLGESSPIGILFASLIFAVLQVGRSGMTVAGIPPEIVSIVTAAIIFFVAIKFVIEKILPKAKEFQVKRISRAHSTGAAEELKEQLAQQMQKKLQQKQVPEVAEGGGE